MFRYLHDERRNLKRERERDEKGERSNVENGNDLEKDIHDGEKADIGMKERLELATGLEVVIFLVSYAKTLHRCPRLPLYTSASTSVSLEGAVPNKTKPNQENSVSIPKFPI